MTIILGFALGLILVGLLMCVLAGKTGYPMLDSVVRIVGVILIVVGLILLVTPVLVWISAQLRIMLGQ